MLEVAIAFIILVESVVLVSVVLVVECNNIKVALDKMMGLVN